jgi:quinohemoprotein ethanol dehydrogenase
VIIARAPPAPTTGIRCRSIPGPASSTSPRSSTSFGYRFDPEFESTAPALQHRRRSVGGDRIDGRAGRSVGAICRLGSDRPKEVWRVEHAAIWNGGTLATAGNLVFQGTAHGRLRAYRATDGEALWEAPTGTGVIAPPISYAIDGEQYVAVVAGIGGGMGLASGDPPAAVLESGNAGRVLAWKLGGTATLPAPDPARSLVAQPVVPIDAALVPEQIEAGRRVYTRFCGHCHGPHAISGGVVPDLRRSAPAVYEILPTIVLEGSLLARGMPSFAGLLDAEQLAEVRQYLLSRRAALVAESRASTAGR